MTSTSTHGCCGFLQAAVASTSTHISCRLCRSPWAPRAPMGAPAPLLTPPHPSPRRQLGPPPHHRAHQRDAQLGDGAEALVPQLQDPHLLRGAEGTPAEAPGDPQPRVPDGWVGGHRDPLDPPASSLAHPQGWTKPNAFHVCITSYKLVLQDHQAFRRKNWKYLILDEAQNIKNFKSQRWQSLLNFNRCGGEHPWVLAGCPKVLQNI